MFEGIGHPIPHRRRILEAYEVALIALGIGVWLALLVAKQRGPLLFEVSGVTLIYGAVIIFCRIQGERLRICFIASYLFVLWFYFSIQRITPALGTKLRDRDLLMLDQLIFRQTPSVYFERAAIAWLTDLMSLCYLTYHVYLIMAVVQVLRAPKIASERLGAYLFMGFAAGFSGYLLVPAVGPAYAYVGMFQAPLPGGAVSRLIGMVMEKGSSVYDAFPSLHVLITCILLDHDWSWVRRRFWSMIVPSIGLVVSTIYLRYHYGVDVLVGILLFIALRQTILKTTRRKVGCRK